MSEIKITNFKCDRCGVTYKHKKKNEIITYSRCYNHNNTLDKNIDYFGIDDYFGIRFYHKQNNDLDICDNCKCKLIIEAFNKFLIGEK